MPSHPNEPSPPLLAPDGANAGLLLAELRPALRRLVDRRLDARVRGRLDPSDVLQEAFVEVTRRLPEYLARRAVPFRVWVHFITSQKLDELHRHHLGRGRRDARREQQREGSSLALPAPGPTPSQAAVAHERALQLAQAIAGLGASDRELVILRHVDGLSHAEIAALVGTSAGAVRVRYLRAMQRLGRTILERGGQ